jgi:dTDP-L-rhamnose 4-epimerase
LSLVLVTGGAGFIGSHTVDKLINEGLDVRILDNLQKPVHLKGKPGYLNHKAEFIFGDVRNKKDIELALKDVDYIFHFAAYQDYLTDFSNFFHTNSVSTALIYEVIVEKKLKIKKIIVASSQFVQGEGVYKNKDGKLYYPDLRPLNSLEQGIWDWHDENGGTLDWMWTPESYSNPPNAYAMSKYSQELQAMKFGKRYEIPSVALRYSIVQGPRQSFYNTYSGACRIFSLSYYLNNAPVIYEDGEQRRDFINVHDAVEANFLVLNDNRADYGVFNVGGGKPYTIAEFDRIVAKVFKKEDILPNIPGKFRFGDTRNACSDISKISKIGFTPVNDAYFSVQEYKDYLESQKDIDDFVKYANEKMKQMNIIINVKNKN